MISIPMRVANTAVSLPVEKSESAVSLPARPGVEYNFAPRAVYSGPYVITPTINEQTFVTKNKAMSDNLTINPFLWDWKGSTVKKLDLTYSEETALEDTDYATWTPSTTAAVIVATKNLTQTLSTDMAQYEYILHWSYRFDAAYSSGATMKAQIVTECQDAWQHLFRRPSNLTNLDSETFNSNVCVTMTTAPLLVYYNTSGTKTMTYSNTYGIYPAVQAATFSSTTSDTPTITIKTPTCSARCNSSYFALARAPELDQENSKFKWDFECFRVPQGGVLRSLYNNVVDTYNDGI